jgi:hypothetical protein
MSNTIRAQLATRIIAVTAAQKALHFPGDAKTPEVFDVASILTGWERSEMESEQTFIRRVRSVFRVAGILTPDMDHRLKEYINWSSGEGRRGGQSVNLAPATAFVALREQEMHNYPIDKLTIVTQGSLGHGIFVKGIVLTDGNSMPLYRNNYPTTWRFATDEEITAWCEALNTKQILSLVSETSEAFDGVITL